MVSPKKIRAYLKDLCKQCGFENPRQYKLHTFRHFFASYCAQQNLSYKYAPEWMGHSSSAILDMYFTMNDRQAQAMMNSLSFNSEKAQNRTILGQSGTLLLPKNTSPSYTALSTYKKHQKRNGEGGIRTRGTSIHPYDGLANRCLQPLGHLSKFLLSERL